MKNFISSLYIKTNAVSDEKICVGLFVGNEKKPLFAWSDRKLKLAAKLLPEDVYTSLNRTFINIKKDTERLKKSEGQITPFVSNPYTADYFEYLSGYEKGLLEFGKPKNIAGLLNEPDFSELFKLYVGEELDSEAKAPVVETFYRRVKSQLDKPVFNEKADVFYKLPSNLINTIYRSHSVDFISCNGNIFAGHSIDFNTGPDTIEAKLYEIRAVVEGLRLLANHLDLKGHGTYRVYHNEPVEKEQKKIFDNVRKDTTKPFELANVEEIDKAAKVLESHTYRKFSEVVGL